MNNCQDNHKQNPLTFDLGEISTPICVGETLRWESKTVESLASGGGLLAKDTLAPPRKPKKKLKCRRLRLNQIISKNEIYNSDKLQKWMDEVGIEPTTSRMQSERYYHWSIRPEQCCMPYFCLFVLNKNLGFSPHSRYVLLDHRSEARIRAF